MNIMVKKCLLFACIGLFIACGSGKPVVQTTKPVNRTNRPVVRAVQKPVQKPVDKPVTEKTTQTAENRNNQNTEILAATTRVKVTTAMVLEYIEKYKGIAKQDMLVYGIPASITLGQGILESGAGTGPLSAQANNHFGIKCHKEWTGPSIRYDDDEAQECFRKYENPDESFRDHSLFLTSRPRYAALFKLEKNDYIEWAKGLRAAGYATDKEYANKLIGLIERYQLQRYDAEVLGREFIAKPKEITPKVNDSIVNNTPNITLNADQHLVAKGDTLYSISKRYNISVDDLKKKNNILDNAISIGQTLQIK